MDESTRRQLEHGQRVTELMKQKQYSPLSVAEMAVSLYCANEGYLDDVDVSSVLDFERELIDFMHAEHQQLLDTIDASGDYNDDIQQSLKNAVERFKSTRN